MGTPTGRNKRVSETTGFDPDAALARARMLTCSVSLVNTLFRARGDISPIARTELRDRVAHLRGEQAEVFAALDEWLAAGGSLPLDWQTAPPGCTPNA